MADLQEQTAIPGTAQCEITGKWVHEDELVEIQGKHVCAEGKQILLDRLAAGENATGELETPGILLRFGCAFLDGIIVGIAGALIGGAAGGFLGAMFGETGILVAQGVGSILGAAASTIYYTLMHGYKGQSVGKMAGKIKVVRMDGSPISMKQSFWRAMFFAGIGGITSIPLLFLPLMSEDVLAIVTLAAAAIQGIYGLANAIAVLIDSKYRRALHDHIAGTRVVSIG